MARGEADKNAVCFFYESGTYANVSGNAQWIGQVQSHEPDEDLNIEYTRYMGGNNDRNFDQAVSLVTDAGGKLVMYPQDFKFLALTLGSNVDGGSPSPYTHTISEVNSNNGNYATSGAINPFLSFQIEDAHVMQGTGLNVVRTAVGCVVDKYSLKWEKRGFITNEIEYIAQAINFSSGAASTPTDPATKPFLARQVKFYAPSGTLIAGVNDGEFFIENNAERSNYSNGSAVTQAPLVTERNYGLNLNLDEMSEHAKTIYTSYFKGGSAFNATIEITDSTGSRDAFIFLSGCSLRNHELPSKSEGINEHTLTIVPQSATALINDAIFQYNAW